MRIDPIRKTGLVINSKPEPEPISAPADDVVEKLKKEIGHALDDLALMQVNIAKNNDDSKSWEPREKQQPTPMFPEQAPNCEVLAVAGFIQELLEAKHLGTPEKPRACLLEATVREGEDKAERKRDGTRVFRVFKSRTYQNYQLTAFNTAVPDGMARVYEMRMLLTVKNEPITEEDRWKNLK